MHKFSNLLKDLPALRESRMVVGGFAVWMVWKGDLPDAIQNTFQDYGGLRISEERNQSLWFFFGKDVFRGLARLQVWARMNDLPVYIQVLPTKLLLGFQLEITLSLGSEFFSQQAMAPDEFEIWIHPGVRQDVEGMPGISLEPVDSYAGLTTASWRKLTADPRLAFGSTLAWYFILRPLGNPMDKAFVEGWRAFFGEVQKILQRLKLKYILHDNFLIFQLENYRSLKSWTTEILAAVRNCKEAEPPTYWPSAMVAVEKGNLHFNEDLPKKVALDWNKMVPDFPHLTYRTAFMLGSQFKIKDVSYSLERSKVTDWCYVHLADADLAASSGTMAVSMPVTLLAGELRPCFYCGLRTHAEPECPTRELAAPAPEVFSEIGQTPLEEINAGLAAVGEALAVDPKAGMRELLRDGSKGTLVARAVHEINAPVQFPFLRLVWRSLGEDLPGGLDRLAPDERHPYMVQLEALVEGDPFKAERLARQESLRAPRDYEYYLVQALVALERGDLERAGHLFKETEALGRNALHFAYLKFLQGRLCEVQARFDEAMNFYKQAETASPKWSEPHYRQAVSMVKMGFADHAVTLFAELIAKDPNFFNRVLLDPELERGMVQLLSALWDIWSRAKADAAENLEKLKDLAAEFEDWFGEKSDFNRENQEEIGALLKLAEVENYVVFQRIIKSCERLTKRLKARVDADVKVLEKQAKDFRERLKTLHREISWFPFPKTLREFNKDFNFCVHKLNWVKGQHFQIAENFRKSREFFNQVEEKLKKLGGRLVTLKIIRDSTLFLMILGKSFMWLEIIGLGVSLIVIPTVVYMAEKSSGGGWLREMILGQKWGLQKGLVIFLSLAALTAALLRTALVYDKKKEKFFKEYEESVASARKR
jgi:tetratricopeptide (TPR) repeat protein